MLFAVGDIHGCADELRLLVNRLPLNRDATVVFLGDMIDRGPRSREVVETILELGQTCQVVALLGNHEAMLLDYLDDPTSAAAGAFVYNGGSATLASYAGPDGQLAIPDHHLAFFRGLRLSYSTATNFFVHAGVPNIPLDQLDPAAHRAAMLWMRGRFLTTDYEWSRVVVHGHTVVDRPAILPNRINLDTGCVFHRRLTAIALPSERLFSVKETGVNRRIVLRDPSSRREAFRFQGEVPVELHRGTQRLAFVTVDYSELGMYLRALDPSAALLDVGERIAGVVGPDGDSRVSFQGVIVRRRVDDGGVHYGVKILLTP